MGEEQTHFSIIKVLLFFFSIFVVYGTVIPFNFIENHQEIIRNISTIKWIPFLDTSDNSLPPIPDIVQNILFFIPFGFLGFFVNSKKGNGIWRCCFKITLLASFLSLSVEVLQLFTKDRLTSTTDLITNTIGAFAGFLLAYSILKIFTKMLSVTTIKKHLTLPASYPFLVALVIVIADEWQPFDFSLDVGFVWSKIKKLINNPFTFSSVLRDELVICFHFFLFSFVSTILLRDIGLRRYLSKGIFFCIAIGVFLEANQIIIGSRMPGFQDVLTISTGCICGGLFVEKFNQKRSDLFWSAWIIILTILSVGVRMLSPFHIASVYREFNLTPPFLGYYEQTTFVALSNFIEVILIYFPMGFVIQLIYHKKKNVIFIVGFIALCISFPLECLQGWIVGRYPSITDVIGAFIGTLLGVWTYSSGLPSYHHYIQKINVISFKD